MHARYVRSASNLMIACTCLAAALPMILEWLIKDMKPKTGHNVWFYRCLKRREKLQASVPATAADAELRKIFGTGSCRSIDAKSRSLSRGVPGH